MPSCQAPSCLTVISTEVEKSPHSILLAVRDKNAHAKLSGAVKKDLHFSQPLFYAAIFVNDSKRPVLIVISSGAACRYQEKWFCAL